MPIVPQHAVATADGDGDATFVFPDVPQGTVYCGTTQISGAPSTAVGVVTGSGEYFGDMYGPGSYGPWTCGSTQKLAISATGLTPGTQYEAVWHADSEGAKTSTYPAPITPVAVSGGGTVDVGNFPAIQTVDGTVIADQGGAPWAVTGVVASAPALASSAPGGQVVMTGSGVALPSHAATAGVVLSAPITNAHPIEIDGGFIVEPGEMTPLLPVTNSDVFTATGTASDVLSFLVT